MTRRLERSQAGPFGKPCGERSESIRAGSWGDRQGRVFLIGAELMLFLYAILLPLALLGLSSMGSQPRAAALIQPLLLFLNAFGGFLVGLEFPLASHLYLKKRSVGQTAGILYATDLLGALVGSLVVAAALLPALGIIETCFLLAALKMLSLSLVIGLQ